MMKVLILGTCLALVLVGLMVGSPGASAAEWIVDDDAGPWANFTTIQDAVDASSGGDTIRVYNGTYKESVTVDVNVFITGNGTEGPNATNVMGTTEGYAFRTMIGKIFIERMNITATADGIRAEEPYLVWIRNNTIHSGTDGIDANDTSELYIQNNTFRGCDAGVSLTDGINTFLHQNVFEDCNIGVIARAMPVIVVKNNIQGSITGISLNDANGSVVRGNLIDMRDTWETTFGIRVQSSYGVTISNNGIDAHNPPTSVGIHLYYSGTVTLTDNAMDFCGVRIEGVRERHFDSHTFTGNKVNGRGIIYYVRQSSLSVSGSAGQVILVDCSRISVEDLVLVNATVGVHNVFSDETAFEGTTVSGCMYGIWSYRCNSTYLNGTAFEGNYIGHYASDLDGCKARDVVGGNNSYAGFLFSGGSGLALAGATMTGDMYGLMLSGTVNATIAGIAARSCYIDVFVTSTQDLFLDGLASYDSRGYSISLESLSHGTIENVIVTNASHGISTNGAEDVLFRGNVIEARSFGLSLFGCWRCRVWDNEFINGSLFMDGPSIEYWTTNDIPDNNTVAGDPGAPGEVLPILFLANASDQVVTGGYGQVILANCSNVTVTDMSMVGSSVPLSAGFSDNCTFEGNTLVRPTYYGVYFDFCENLTVQGNELIRPEYFGLAVGWHTNSAVIRDNTFMRSRAEAIYISLLSGTVEIYLNRFEGNAVPGPYQVLDLWAMASWDNGTVGNWWSDYTGDDSDGDGIGDAPHLASYFYDPAFDDYPLGNFEPELVGWPVMPANGTPDTEFTFTVTYRDPDGRPPANVTIDLMGEQYEMVPGADPDWAAGVNFTHTTTLGRGDWYYHFNASDGWRTNTTTNWSGPHVNRLPELTDISILPHPARSIDLVTFSAIYRDDDNDTPVQVVLDIAGMSFNMSQMDENDKFYYGGVAFHVGVQTGPGNFTYSFSAFDGWEWNITNGTYLWVNSPPDLTGPDVSPDWGSNETAFNFTVLYGDADGHAPAGVWLSVDGIEFAMLTAVNLTTWDGLTPIPYYYETMLYFGLLEFYFIASDPYEWTATANDTVRVNHPPRLRDAGVTPESGNTSHVFTFNVTYRDGDGDPPEYVRVTIDTVDFVMVPTTNSTDYLTGVGYAYITYLDAGLHIFTFSTSDGYAEEETAADSVNVEQSDLPVKPLAYIDEISPAAAEAGTPVHLEGHGSGGTITDYEWVSDIDDVIGTAASVDTTGLSLGTHLISFRVRNDDDLWSDPVNGTVTIFSSTDLPDARVLTLTVLPQEPEEGKNVTIVAAVSNDGDAEGTFMVGFYVTTLEVYAGPADLTMIASRNVTLAPEGTTDLTVTWVPDEAGDYTMVVWADPAGELVEERENNNIKESAVTVEEAEEEPPVPPEEEGDQAVIDPVAAVGIAVIVIVILALIMVMARRKGRRGSPRADDRWTAARDEEWRREDRDNDDMPPSDTGRGRTDDARREPPQDEGRWEEERGRGWDDGPARRGSGSDGDAGPGDSPRSDGPREKTQDGDREERDRQSRDKYW